MSGGDLVWLPWVVALAALALAGAWWASRRGDAPAALRRLGYAVGVLGLWGLGVPTLLARLWSTLSGWVTRLVFNPLSWLGLAATVVAVLMVLVGLAWGRRRESSPQPRAVQKSSSKAVATSSTSSEDEEIEALLRKHGIS
jgi:type IV secretory pathway TrbL component